MALKFVIPSNIFDGALLWNDQGSSHNPTNNFSTELVNKKVKFWHYYKTLLQSKLFAINNIEVWMTMFKDTF